MTKPQAWDSGKYDARAGTYSADHRKWGGDLYMHDIDGAEWTHHGGRWFPVALIEECCIAADVSHKQWQLPRTLELSEKLSAVYGYRVGAYFVRWSADPAQPVGERITELLVTCLNNQQTATLSRDQWINYLRLLRRRVVERLSEAEALPDLEREGEQRGQVPS